MPTRCGVTRGLAVAVIASLVLVAEASAGADTATGAARILEAETIAGGDGFIVRWRASRADAPVRVLASSDPAAAPATMALVGHGRGDGSLDVPRPRDGHRVYFYVATDDGGVRTATRQIPLSGASNFRDLGGYPAQAGKHVVWGRLFRSNALADLTADDYRIVGSLGVRLVCDLRTEPERTRQPTRWPTEGSTAPPTFVTASDPELAARLKAALAGGTRSAASARAAMLHLYEQLPELYAADYRRLFARLVAGETPLIVHCTAGKDRTGLAVALLLTTLGVPRSVVDADYALSATLRAAAKRPDDAVVLKSRILSDSSATPEAMAAIEASDPAYLAAAFTRIVGHWGSVDAYLEQVLGVGARERALLQARYLE